MPSGRDEASNSAEAVSAVESRAQVARILESRHFAKAERLKRFLRFVTEEALKGLSAEIKETVIGIEVFDRDAAIFDPRLDPIVRVQAGRVRAKLAGYYAHEGTNDRVLVELPRGHYIPQFRTQGTASARSPRALANKEPAPWRSNTIAVLPFVNLSGDTADDNFSDGLTEELVHALARLPSFRITARNSALQFRRTDLDIREIGRLLGAAKIVKGSVRRVDDRLWITVQLVNVADGYQLWSEKYDRTTNNVLALQKEIVGAVRMALRGVLADGRVPRAGLPTGNINALNQYLLGRFHWNKRNEPGFRAAISHFRNAIQIDPDYGRAHSGIADCYIMLAMSGAEAPAACMPLAREAAMRALEIDDRLVEAHTSLGVVRAGFQWDWNASEIEFQRALECDPGYATLHHWYSIYSLGPLGRFDEAEDEIERAEQLDPTSLSISLARAQTLFLAGDFPAAVAHCLKVLRLDGRYYRAYWWMGLAHARLGNFEAASEALETARARSTGETAFRARILGALGNTYARWGKTDRALAIVDELDAVSQANYVDSFEMAHVQAGLGQTDAALHSLEHAAADRSGWLIYCGVWPAFDGLRANTRYLAILDRLSLRRPATE